MDLSHLNLTEAFFSGRWDLVSSVVHAILSILALGRRETSKITECGSKLWLLPNYSFDISIVAQRIIRRPVAKIEIHTHRQTAVVCWFWALVVCRGAAEPCLPFVTDERKRVSNKPMKIRSKKFSSELHLQMFLHFARSSRTCIGFQSAYILGGASSCLRDSLASKNCASTYRGCRIDDRSEVLWFIIDLNSVQESICPVIKFAD